ncbi:MAG: hypothetical protein WC581_13760 [Thermodesulfovibrionales bacterium]
MTDTNNAFNTLCNIVALIYHESRNVRHLVNQNLLAREPWLYVISLPINRDDAWCDIAPLRDKALKATSVDSALLVFESRFHVSLCDLKDMFANENWRHAKLYGGNAWVTIVNLAVQLADSLRSNNVVLAQSIETQLKSARHNTGLVYEKIFRLEKERDR